ncbi:hypothetical protein PBY51_024926 [Eleginops maclovinus]|uniref:Uncharacterized protein n=1 Tax=Eleginops maclovinus TaxID=56733 RepID=A0AAN7Y0V8_ELEMC|nr:hypothetical protein PBY51_024926 [Eleginops maclovinus]
MFFFPFLKSQAASEGRRSPSALSGTNLQSPQRGPGGPIRRQAADRQRRPPTDSGHLRCCIRLQFNVAL